MSKRKRKQSIKGKITFSIIISVVLIIAVIITINIGKGGKTNLDNEIAQTLITETTSSVSSIKPEVSSMKTEITSIASKEQNIEDSNPFSDSEYKLKECADEFYYGVYYFNDGTYYYNESSKTPSASVIKIFIMQYVYESFNAKALNKGTKDLVDKMIQYSDNDATNTLIDEIGMSEINEFILKKGYTDTILERRMLDFDAQKSGKDNYTSLNDVMTFLKNLYDNSDVSPYKEMLDILKGQTIRTKIPKYLPEDVIVANKTGELDQVENDIGIVFPDESKEFDFAIVVLTNDSKNPENTRDAIGNLAKKAYELSIGI